MGFYTKYSDTEILESYKEMLDHNGEIDTPLLEEINKRGGIEKFQLLMNKATLIKKEQIRISKEIKELQAAGVDLEFIRKMVSSSLLSPTALDNLITERFNMFAADAYENKIDIHTILGALTGFAIGTFLGGALYISPVILILPLPFSGVLVFGITYLFIWLITKKSKNNIIVFLLSFLSIFTAFFMSMLLQKLLF